MMINLEREMSFDKDTWSTPQYLFNWLNNFYNFDIDLCASEENNKCDNYFNKDDNALKMDWCMVGHRNTGFCNPPYSNIKPWIKKAIMLIPTPNGESYYQDIFENATGITFITGRIAFYNPALKKEVAGNTRGSCVVQFSRRYIDYEPIIDHVMRDDLKRKFTYRDLEGCHA